MSQPAEPHGPLTGQRDTLALALATGQLPEPLGGRVRGAQIQAVLRLTPYTALANAVNVAALSFSCVGRVSAVVIGLWAAAVLAHVTFGVRAWQRSRTGRALRTSPRAISAAIRHAVILAGLWGVVPAVVLPVADADGRLLVACLMCGMICAGGFAMATVPVAAVAWVAILGSGSLVGLLSYPDGDQRMLLALLLVYCGIVVASTLSTARLFVKRFLVEAELEHKSDVIKLLLNEFEETASDWLWETDAQGIIQRASPRFIAASGRKASEIENVGLISVLVADRPGAQLYDEIVELRETMAGHGHFRDLQVPVLVDGSERWWSLSGRPVETPGGRFAGYRGVASDVTEQRRASELVAHLATHDSLTALGNRSWFRERAESILDSVVAGDASAVLMLVDLDHFKSVNDTRGHPVGDALLAAVGDRLREICPPGAALARLGGDEFAVMATLETTRSAEVLASAIIASLSRPFQLNRHDLMVGATIGFAIAPDNGSAIDDLMRRADIALYEAKRAGRGRARAFSIAMEHEILARRQMETNLRADLARDRLELAYQPIVDAKTEAIIGYEALLRWHSDVHGEVSPSVFVPLAEEVGLIDQIGEWVIRKACRAAATWPAPMRVAVNLSSIQFHGPNLVGTVKRVLAESGLDADRLELEITETVLIRDTPEVGRAVKALSDIGIRIALDDFGTGYSSLSYLRRYPFRKLKIDRSFTEELATEPQTLAITRAIVMLARSLDMEITAEGVETREQADLLRSLGCDSLQGYLFGRPAIGPGERVPRIRLVKAS